MHNALDTALLAAEAADGKKAFEILILAADRAGEATLEQLAAWGATICNAE